MGHGIARFGNVLFACAASYGEARRKLEKCQYMSDLASEDEPP